MKEELNDVLNETMEEEVVEGNKTPITEDEQDIPISEQFDDEEGNEDEASINDEPSDEEDPDLEDEGSAESDELDIDDIDSEDEEEESAMDDEGDDDVLDMTDASDDEVLKVFKSMKPEDGIVVKKDGDNVELEDGDDEYIIKLDSEEGDIDETNEGDAHEMGEGDMEAEEEVSEETEEEVAEEAVEEEVSEDMEAEEEVSEGDDTVYEIELDDVDEGEVSEEVTEGDAHEGEGDDDVAEEVSEEEVSEEEVSEEEETHEEDVDEAARTTSNVHGDKGGQNRAGIKGKTKYKSGAINEEVKTLKKQNTEYKKALILFKEKLNEVAVFNANLAYATRLFTEHSTTRHEKLNILKRFDSVTSLTESKSTYKTIKTELDSSKNITETVVDKIASTPTTSSSQEVLSETKAYESPQFKRMKDLMSKIK